MPVGSTKKEEGAAISMHYSIGRTTLSDVKREIAMMERAVSESRLSASLVTAPLGMEGGEWKGQKRGVGRV